MMTIARNQNGQALDDGDTQVGRELAETAADGRWLALGGGGYCWVT